ncbi:MAG: DUF349 domain-containing protein [Pseudomonadota bacterium]
MSLFSRFFRKAPSLSPAPSSASAQALSEKADKALPKQTAADRALAVAAEEKALQSAIEIGDTPAVARLVLAGTSTKVRQAAAQAIDDPELLRQLIRDVRGGNDNNVYKVLTSKRDAQLEQTRKVEQLRVEIEAAAGALDRHSQGPYDTSYEAALIQYESRWELVAAQADPALRDSARQSSDRARETIAGHLRQLAAQALSEQAAANAAAEAVRLREQQAQAAAAAAAEQAKALDEQQRALSEKREAEQKAVRQIAESIRKARAALSDGGTSRAAGMRREIEEKLAGAPPLPAQLSGQLQQLDKQLDELKDWKHFSVTPKRAELIEQMESLIGAALEPLVLADQIRRVQDEWRTLGKGVGENLEADLQRFQEAARKAHQPCTEYFAAQALVREENLRRRDVLLTRLTVFEAETDWEQADWQALIRVLRETKQEWRRCAPVERQPGRKQDERFATLTASLQGRMDAEHARNVALKESLIERARQLVASEDGRKAIDAIKGLQQQWRTVGTVPREVDQRLWGEFRQHGDAVFQKREQDAATYTAALQGNKAQAIALCEQLEHIATLEGAELTTRTGTLGELRAAFGALGEFPRADSPELRRRFDQGLERCGESLARQQTRDAERSWSDLFEAANLVRACRLALARRMDAEPLEALQAAAASRIASAQRWPKGGLEALRQALADEDDTDLAANEQALRMLCIRAEILAGLPTPAEDQALRREYQLQRLVQGMGQRLKAGEIPLDAMAMEWVSVGPVEESAYAALQERFRRCREQGSSRVDARR